MTNEKDYYFTLESAFRAPERKVKGSRFTADIFPVGSKSGIDEILATIRKEFYDATHHCYAFVLGSDGKVTRAADDGEPAGTAGKPILLALTSRELTNSLLVVTRYYGGSNLGTGGLSRAYSEAAQQCVANATIKTIYLTEVFDLELHYEELAPLERVLAVLLATTIESDFGEAVRLRVRIRKSHSNILRAELAEKFYGRVLLSEVAPPKMDP